MSVPLYLLKRLTATIVSEKMITLASLLSKVHGSLCPYILLSCRILTTLLELPFLCPHRLMTSNIINSTYLL